MDGCREYFGIQKIREKELWNKKGRGMGADFDF
jgi:hypothetical protein